MKHLTKLALCLGTAALSQTSFGQTKLGDSPGTINSSAILELNSSNKALLLTRVALTSTQDATTITAGGGSIVAGMVVYNTNAAITSNVGYPALGVGVYHWDGTGWVSGGATTASNGLTKTGNDVKLGGPLTQNTTVAGGNFTTEITGTKSASGASVLKTTATPGNAIPQGNDVFAASNAISGGDGQAASATSTTIRGVVNQASTSGNNVRAQGSLNEASSSGTGLGTFNQPASVGATGLADYVGNTDAPAADYLVGVRGATYTSGNKSNGLNVVGMNFGGTYNSSVGGYFYPSNGTSNVGTVNQVGGAANQGWKDDSLVNRSVAVAALNYAVGANDRALLSRGQVQMLGTPAGAATDSVMTMDASGNVRRVTPGVLGGLITADNGLTKTGNNVQLGGSLVAPTTVATDATNTLTVQANNIGGANNDANQGLNVQATSASANRAIGTRSNLVVANGTTLQQARSVSGTTNVYGKVDATATGGYFNTVIRPGSDVSASGTITGASGDVEVLAGTANISAAQTLTGARFGSDATNATAARTTGVTATAVNSVTSNVGLAAGTSTEAQLKTSIAAQPAGFNTGVYAYNNTNGANSSAGQFLSTNNVGGSTAMKVLSAPGAVAGGSELFASDNRISATSSGATTTLRAQYNNAQSPSNNVRVHGSLNEASAGGTGLGASNTPQATGTTGLADYTGAGAAAADDYIVGVRGATYTPGGASVTNGISVLGSNFGGAYDKSVGGYFAPSNGATNIGTVNQIGGGTNAGWKDGDLAGKNVAVAALNYNAASANDRAILAKGAVQLMGTPTGAATDSIMTMDGTGNVRRVSPAVLGGLITADNGLTKTGNNVQLGGTLTQNTTVTGGNFNTNFNSTSTDANHAALTATANPGNSIPQGREIFGATSTVTGTDGVGAASATTTTLRAQVNQAATSGNNVRAQGSLNEASSSGTGLGAFNQPSAAGATGLADYVGGADAPANDYLVGVRGATYTSAARTTGINVAGVTFSGNFTNSVGGYFLPKNGTTNIGTVAQVGGTDNQGWKDTNLTGKNVASASVDYVNDVNSRAIFSSGKVQLTNLSTETPDQLLAVNVNGIVTKTALPGTVTADNGLTKTGNNVQLGGALTQNTTVAGGAFNTTINSTSTTASSAALSIDHTPSAALPSGTEIFGGKATATGNTATSVGSGAVTVRGQINQAFGNGNNIRVHGSLNEAQAFGSGLGAVGDGIPQATGVTGLADYKSASDAPVTDYVVGTRGAAYTDGGRTNGLSVVGMNFGGAYYRSIGGYFRSTNGTDANIGTIAQIGGAENAGWKDAAFDNLSVASASIDYTNTANSRAIYSNGRVQMTGLSTETPDQLLAVNVNGIVTRTALPGVVTADNGLTKTGNNVQLGGTLTTPVTEINTGSNTLAITGAGNTGFGTITPTNKVEIVATGITGATKEAGQALSVTATTAAGTSSSAIVGRVQQTADVVGESRAVNAENIVTGGSISKANGSGNAAGGVFASLLVNGGSLANDGSTMTGVTGSTFVGTTSGSSATGTTNTVAGGVFSASAANTDVFNASSVGVLATSKSSSTFNLGVLAIANDVPSYAQPYTFAALGRASNATTGILNGSAAIAAINGKPSTPGHNERAIYADGGVQFKSLGTTTPTNIVGIDVDGNLSVANLPTVVTASNGLTLTANDVKLGGALATPTQITTTGTNTLTVSATGVGNASQELGQGVNVFAIAANNADHAIALRGRVNVASGTSVNQARGGSGVAFVEGTITGTATGAYFNTNLRPTANLNSNVIVTGVSADAEAFGGLNTNVNASNTLAGARFGSSAVNAPTARATGIMSTAVNSNVSNVGTASSATVTAAQLSTQVATLPTGANVATYAYNPAAGSNDYAVYSDGNVRVNANPTSVNTTLQVNGSVSAKVRTITGTSYVIQTDDYFMIFGTGFAAPRNLDLTSAASFPGRVIIIKNITTNNLNMTAYTNANGNPVTVLNPNRTLTLISDGTVWQAVSEN